MSAAHSRARRWFGRLLRRFTRSRDERAAAFNSLPYYPNGSVLVCPRCQTRQRRLIIPRARTFPSGLFGTGFEIVLTVDCETCGYRFGPFRPWPVLVVEDEHKRPTEIPQWLRDRYERRRAIQNESEKES